MKNLGICFFLFIVFLPYLAEAQVPKPYGLLQESDNGLQLDTSNMQWYTYHNNGYSSIIHQNFDTVTHTFIDFYKSIYAYDGNDKLTGRTDFLWDRVTNVWDTSARTSYTYNSSGQLQTSRIDRYTNTWELLNLDSMFYGSNGKLELKKIYWVSGPSSYDYSGRHEYTYDSNDSLSGFLYLWINSAGTAFDSISRYSYSHDLLNGTATVIWEDYFNTSGWEKISKRVDKEGPAPITDSIFSYFWDNGSMAWLNSSLETMTFHSDLSRNLEDLYTWNDVEMAYVPIYRGTYLYGSPAGLNDHLHASQAQFFPNPVKSELNIRVPASMTGGSYQLISANGRLADRGRIDEMNQTITVDHLQSGLYILRIDNGRQTLVHRMIKE